MNRRRMIVLAIVAIVGLLVVLNPLRLGSPAVDPDGNDPPEVLAQIAGRPGGAGQGTPGGAQEGQGRGTSPNPPGQGPSPTDPPPFDSGQGSCQVDTAHAGYTAAFDSSLETYAVTEATISNLSPSCQGATLTVTLDDGSADGTSAKVISGSVGEATVAFTEPAAARDVVAINVVLEGGTTPVPEACQSMTFDHVKIGDTSDNVLEGSPLRDLMYGIGGNNTIFGGPQNDCLVGGPGQDTLRGEAGNDVLIANGGDWNVLEGGPGHDVLIASGPNDILDGGPGNDTCYVVEGYNPANVTNCQAVIEMEP